MEQEFTRENVDFYSNGVRCSAWLYLPKGKQKCPVIVMAHGLGGVREMRLDAYAQRFAAAGYACFLFDYRNYGASDILFLRIIGIMRTCQLQSVGEVANPAGAINARDERRISCTAIDSTAWFSSAVIKACKLFCACTPSPILDGSWMS